MEGQKWYKNVYRRTLLDMHINDRNDGEFSLFSADKYVDCLKKAKIESPMIYIQSHTGHCYYPTKTAVYHSGVSCDDKIKTLIDKCVAENMKVVGYYSVIYNTWAELNHPDWAMRFSDGESHIQKKQRYGLCCPNNMDYRKFVDAQISEAASHFGQVFSGMFYDMLFWPIPCYCDACKKRWAEEVGGEMPTIEDETDERWNLLLRKRQVWMGDFCNYVRDTSKKYFPTATVEMNYAGVMAFGGWAGSTELVNDACEFAGGDLYGDLLNHSFSAKYYLSVSRNQPFEYMVGRCDENLNEHTATKSYKQLATETFLTIAHHGANFIIDAIDPVGTVDERVYDRIGKIFDNLKDYEPYLDGNLLADVGVFFDSKIKNYSDSNPEFDNKSCSVNAVRTLIEKHIPTAVFANGVLDKIFDYKLVVAGRLKDFYTEYEDVLKEYVKNGGALYLSGKNNLSLMKEFFGAEFLGFTKETKTYVRPTKDFGEVLGEFTENYPMPVNYALPVYKVDDSCVKGYVTLPYTDPADYINFASIHSNPPGIKTQIPAIMVKDYGKGKVMWSACSIENETRTCFKEVFANVINYLIGKDALSVNVVTAKCVEAVFFKTKDGYLFSLVDLVNTEDEIAKDFTIKIKCDRKVKRVVRLPDLKDVPFICDENSVTVSGEVTNFDMYKIITE